MAGELSRALADCDRHLFRARTGPALTSELVDITDVILDKVTVLRMRGSQMHPTRKMHRPIRRAWTTVADLLAGTGTYAERFYRTESREEHRPRKALVRREVTVHRAPGRKPDRPVPSASPTTGSCRRHLQCLRGGLGAQARPPTTRRAFSSRPQ
ncbi:hypothetical protein OG735_22660 [Streptomyces sp. NBC_01210]|uniref:hypothetical protein n=1 Tax=Streptomyces sp. NBC_01210 TaxID=2903774 RepID=UPI002E15FA25|nr:hypothetical protein OG735_22660 [Streptomyces sp. NBC_01210]